MEIPFRIRFVIEIFAMLFCAFVLRKYGVLPVGIILAVLVMIFADMIFPDEENFKNKN